MMKKSTRPLIFGAILIAIYSFIFTAYMERIYPVVGHDFSYFMPRLIDTYLHYSINGLAIQWYTPSFGGGVPVYANPQSMQFSLVQAFTSIFNPWLATELAAVVHILVGFWRVISSLKILLPWIGPQACWDHYCSWQMDFIFSTSAWDISVFWVLPFCL